MSQKMPNFKELDINDLPYWPWPFRLAVLVIIGIGVIVGGYYFVIADKWAAYQKDEAREVQLKEDYRTKYQTAVNLPKYQEQLQTMNADLETLLAMLPNTDETPKLLDDITLVGTKSGLSFDRIEWLAPVEREFYTALPMRIELRGEYHQIGDFVGQVAGLHRIISVKDFTLRQDDMTDALMLNINAETYQQQTLRAKQ